MQKVTRGEVMGIADYEQVRPHFRARIIAEKKPRRLAVGEHISVVFENHDTVLYQIQEMLRTERITSEAGIQHEIETYNDLIPGPGQLSFTMFVEIPDAALRQRMLVELEGLERSVALEVDGEKLAAFGDFAGVLPGRTTAVHYLKFDLSAAPGALERMRNKSAKAALVIAHPKHPARTELSAVTLEKLAEDLAS